MEGAALSVQTELAWPRNALTTTAPASSFARRDFPTGFAGIAGAALELLALRLFGKYREHNKKI